MGENQKLPTNTQLLGSLARELKNPLILIARQAELEALSSSDKAYASIKNTAEQTMKLIDSYLLIAQSEYGQLGMPMETIGVGSIIYDAVEEFRPIASAQNVSLVSDVHDATVETNSRGFKTALWCLMNMTLESVASDEKSIKQIIISSKKAAADSVSVSVLGNLDISQKDMSLARSLQGSSHLALGLHSKGSGVHLAIAEIFASSAGNGFLHVAKQGNSRGLSLRLMRSQQLQLI